MSMSRLISSLGLGVGLFGFGTSMALICTMLIIVALPAEGGAPDRDYDVIVNFVADTEPYEANTVRHLDHDGKCGISAGANIPRKNNRSIQLAVFGCLFDAVQQIPEFELLFDMVSPRTIVGMDLHLRRDSDGMVSGLVMWLFDDNGVEYSGEVPFSGPMITQGVVSDVPFGGVPEITVSATQGNGKGKKSGGDPTVRMAKLTVVDIQLLEAP